MAEHFIAEPLDRRHIAQAFPLVRLGVPGLTMDRWRAFARAQLGARQRGGDRGILAVRNPAGYIHGLVIFETSEDLHLGRVLLVSHWVTAQSVGSGAVVSALIAAVEKVARTHECEAVLASLPNLTQAQGIGDHWLAGHFKRAGFELQMIPVVRQVISSIGTAIPLSSESLN